MTRTQLSRGVGLPKAYPLLVILSGPSGVGKDAVLARMKELKLLLHFVVTATTRPRRPGEIDGRDYHFLSQARFQKMVTAGEFLEWASVYGNFYGVPKGQAKEAMEMGQDVIIKLDIQGAATLKRLHPQAVFVFLAPSSMEEVEERLKQRGTESAENFALRIETAHGEMGRLPMFDYVVVNRKDGIDLAVAQIQAIITSEKCRSVQRMVEL